MRPLQPLLIAEPLRRTLAAVATAMEVAEQPWWLIGSAAVALHGTPAVEVRDVDVLVGIADERILAALGVEATAGGGDDLFRSTTFGVWRTQPLTVEIMAGFSLKQGAAWRAIEPATREAVELDGRQLFVPARPELIGILRAFGRPKDLERALLLEAI
ncbi:MAG: hypothetical protein JWP73_2672 [Phenylobacterium sp.]|nr:hypothetical protein [Phenylobacterium sp.]